MWGVNKPGFVYVARAERTGLTKIGFSTNVAARLRSLCSAVGEPVTLVAVARGTRADESALLERVARHSVAVRGNREWHRPHPDLDAIIAEFPAAGVSSISVGPCTPRKNAPRRPREVVAAETERLRQEKAERRERVHGHGPGRVAGCAKCKQELACMATWRARRERAGDAAARAARSAVSLHCAQAPAFALEVSDGQR